MNKLLAMVIVVGGVWMIFWDAIEAITDYLGPILSPIVGIVICLIGFYFWRIKAL